MVKQDYKQTEIGVIRKLIMQRKELLIISRLCNFSLQGSLQSSLQLFKTCKEKRQYIQKTILW